ncbi:MAG: His-Xaa-Ser system protein HxsD [Terriglobales bacterium]
MTSGVEGFQSEADSEFSATIRLDPRIYSREAILRACYWYARIAYIHLPESRDDRLVIRIKLKQRLPTLANPTPISIEEFLGEFCNSLLDFELRRQVEAETSSIRQLILAKAFSESGVLEDEPPGSIADPVASEKPSSLVQIMKGSPAE